MSPNEIRAAAVGLIDAIDGECMPKQRSWHLSVLRGLAWALCGRDPGSLQSASVAHLFYVLGYQVTMSSDGSHFHYGLTDEEVAQDIHKEGCRPCLWRLNQGAEASP